MPTLHELLAAPDRRSRVLTDCERLIDDEVASKRGLTSIPVKAGFKVVKGLRPGFVRAAVDFLLDDFCGALDPFYQRWASEDPASRPPLSEALRRDGDPVADALLGVTDRRAQGSTNRVIVKTYQKLRGTAKGHVREALPGLGRTVEPYLR